MNDRTPDYLVCVPDQYHIAGLDERRWLLVSPAHDGNAVEGHPLTEKEAGYFYTEDQVGIGGAWLPDVRRDLIALETAANALPSAA